MPAPRTVAVVGAGIAGAACTQVLRAAGVDVTVLNKGRVVGGRLASRTLDGRRVDLGASYFTARDPGFVAVVDDWLTHGLARKWTDTFHTAGPDGLGPTKTGPLRYGAPGGLRSLVEDLLTGVEVTSVEVEHIGPGPLVDGKAYDAVVVAMPDPQAARLLDPALTQELSAVRDRPWEPVLAVAAGWVERSWDLDGCFVEGSDVLGWVADDGRRRGDGASVLVAHSTSPFAASFLSDPAGAAAPMLAAMRRLLGIGEPEWSFVQRWTFARPTGSREASYFLGGAGVGLCGDGWGSPRVEAAWVSGTALGHALLAQR